MIDIAIKRRSLIGRLLRAPRMVLHLWALHRRMGTPVPARLRVCWGSVGVLLGPTRTMRRHTAI